MNKICKILLNFFDLISIGSNIKPKLIPYKRCKCPVKTHNEYNPEIRESLRADWVQVGNYLREAMNKIDSDPEYKKALKNKSKIPKSY